jgi:hypothetical protein
MLFELLPNYAHLASTSGTGPAGALMTTVLTDFDEYERRLEQLSSSLSHELSETLQELKSSLCTLQDVLQLEESRAEEETIRMRARASITEMDHAAAAAPQSSSYPFHPQVNGAEMAMSASRLTEFWKEKYHELLNEISVMGAKRDQTLARLEGIKATQGGGSSKTMRAIGALNEKLMEHKQLAQFFVASITRMNDDGRTEAPSAAEAVSNVKRVVVEAEEQSAQRILDAVTREGEALHKLASFLTKRESALKFRVQKMQQKAQSLSLGGGLETAALDDVLYLRAEVRGLRGQLAQLQSEAAQPPHGSIGPSTEQALALSQLQEQHAQLQRRIREARVATIRAEHKSHDGAMIVKRAVDEQRVNALRERLAFVEREKMKELQLSQEASLAAHFDATWMAYSGR